MINRRLYIQIILLLCVLAFSSTGNVRVIRDDSKAFIFELSFDNIHLSKVKESGSEFIKINVGSLSNSGLVGEPLLPSVRYNVGIPQGEYKVNYSVSLTENHSINKPLLPVPKIESGSDGNLYSYNFIPLESVYSSSLFPQSGLLSESIIKIKNQRVVELIISPVQYMPLSGKLQFSKKVRVAVEFSGAGVSSRAKGFENVLRLSLLNYNSAKAFRIPKQLKKSFNIKSNLPFTQNSTHKVFKVRIKSDDEFSTDSEGFYKISGEELELAGGSISSLETDDIMIYTSEKIVLNPKYVSGIEDEEILKEIPVIVTDLNKNGLFDSDDEICFYAFGGSRFHYSNSGFVFQNHPFDFYNYYWVVTGGHLSSKAKHFDTLSLDTAIFQKSVLSYTDIKHYEGNFTNPDNIGGEHHYKVNWMWQKMQSQSVVVKYFTLPLSSTTGQLNMSIRQSSYYDLSLNGVELTNPVNGLYNVSNFKSSNEVRIKLNSTLAYLDWFDISYSRELKADSGSLLFYGYSGKDTLFSYTITGFSNQNLIVADVSNPVSPYLLPYSFSGNNLILKREGYINSADSLKNRKYCVANRNGLKKVFSIEQFDYKSYSSDEYFVRDLRDKMVQTDYVVIAPMNFAEPARRLAKHRTDFKADNVANGKVVFIEDIYNQFSGGKMDYSAIRNFLFFADNFWGTTHALLMGGGHRDFKGYLGVKEKNIIPPYETFSNNSLISHTGLSSAGAADDFYAGDDGVTSNYHIFVGRFPVNSVEEASNVVDKIIDFDTDETDLKLWRNRVILLADDDYKLSEPDPVNTGSTVHMKVMESISDKLPSSMDRVKVYLQEYDIAGGAREKPEAERDLVDAINNGSLIWVFVGHGAFDQITDEKVFTLTNTFPRLKNSKRYGLFWAASCSVGQFDNPNKESICIRLLTAKERGMVVTVGASRASYGGANRAFLEDFIKAKFKDTLSASISMGEAFRVAKFGNENNRNNSRLYNLFGDPAICLYPRIDSIVIQNESSFDTLSALEKLTIKGSVSDPNASGKISVRLSKKESEKQIDYLERSTESSMTIKVQGDALNSVVADIKNGKFDFEFVVPKSVPFLTTGSSLDFFGWYNGKIVEKRIKDIYFSSTISVSPESLINSGPEINIYIGNEKSGSLDFTNPPAGEQITVNEKSVITVILEDKDGVKTFGNLVNEGILYEFQGLTDRKRISSLTSVSGSSSKMYFNLNIEDELLGITDDLKSGEVDLLIMAQDNYDNRSLKKYRVVFADDSSVTLSKEIFNYPNPFKKETRFIWSTGVETDVTIKIFTQSGKLIRILKSFNVLGPYDSGANSFWDGLDEVGNRVARGVYFYTILFKTTFESNNDNSGEKDVNDKASFTGKMMKY